MRAGEEPSGTTESPGRLPRPAGVLRGRSVGQEVGMAATASPVDGCPRHRVGLASCACEGVIESPLCRTLPASKWSSYQAGGGAEACSLPPPPQPPLPSNCPRLYSFSSDLIPLSRCPVHSHLSGASNRFSSTDRFLLVLTLLWFCTSLRVRSRWIPGRVARLGAYHCCRGLAIPAQGPSSKPLARGLLGWV